MSHIAQEMLRGACLYSEQGQLQGIGGGQARQQPALVCEVSDDELLVELGPHAGIADGDGQSHLRAVHCPLGNQYPASCQTSYLQVSPCFRYECTLK